LRFIPGERGESRGGNGAYGSGGGGGSGLLYTTASDLSSLSRTPSLDLADANTSWVLLAVAGGGGGAGLNGVCDGNAGVGGNTLTNGTSGMPNGSNGGTDGDGGQVGGGGGYRVAGDAISLGDLGGQAGRTSGGSGGSGDAEGGFGYGGGSAGGVLMSNGGGGFNGGGGGGSFVNPAASADSKEAGGRTNNPRSGYIEYVIEDSNSPVAVCQDFNVELDANGTATVYPEDVDGGSYDPNGDDAALERIFSGFNGFGFSDVDFLTFNCSDIGVIENTLLFLVVTDQEGLTGACSVSLNIEDNIAPTASCQANLTLVPDETGSITISPLDLDNGSTDNCGTITRTANQTIFTCDNTGTFEVSLSMTDDSDNVSTCTTSVEVIEYVKECPADFCVEIPEDQTEVYIDMPVPTGELGCGFTLDSRVSPVGDFSTTDKSGFYPSGEYLLVWRFKQVNSTRDVCLTRISVRQIEPYTCAPDFEVTIPDNSCEIYIDIPEPISDIPCGFSIMSNLSGDGEGYSAEDKSGLFAPGSYTVFWRLEEDNTVRDMCSTTFTVRANEPLNAVCKNITIELDETGEASIQPEHLDNGSTGECGIANRSLSQSAFTCTDVGDNMVTLTIEDNNNGTQTCNALVTVEDNQNPTATCPPSPPVVQLDENGMGTLAIDALIGFSTDNCAIQSESSPMVVYSCSDQGTQEVALTVVDANGKQAQRLCEVTVEEAVNPVAVCQNITVQLEANGEVSITGAMINNGSISTCGIQSFTLDKSTFTCDDEGANTVTLTAANQAGQSSSCTATVTVENNVPPAARCKFSVFTSFNDQGVATITPPQINNGSVDVCGDLIEMNDLSLDVSTFFGVDGNDPRTVTLTVTDVRGRTDQCTSTVYLIDSEDPVCKSLPSLTVSLDETGNYELFAEEVDNGSTDNTGILNFVFVDGGGDLESITYSCDQSSRTLPVFLKVIDGNENENECGLTRITIRDEILPDAICQNVLVNLDEDGNGSLTPGQVDNGSSDNCGIQTYSLSKTEFTCSDIGSETLTLTVTDGSDNDQTCDATVTVVDNINPTAVCPETLPVIQLDENGTGSLPANALVGASTDNCGIQMETSLETDFTCDQIGTQSVLLSVQDMNGNSDSKLCDVLVADNLNPTVVCPATPLVIQLDENGMGRLLANALAGASTDNCGIQTEISLETDFTCDQVGTQSVQLSVQDVNGNSDSQSCQVLVEDNIDPTAVCPEISPVVQLDENGMGRLPANALAGASTDNCGIQTEMSPELNFTCDNIGTQQVLLTVTDMSDNIGRSVCRVEVVDNVTPQMACQNVTVQLNEQGLGLLTKEQVDNGSNDACGIADLSLSKTAFTCNDVGSNMVTLTVTDNNDNTNTCTATVTVEDKVRPTMVCPSVAPLVQLDYQGTGTLAANALAGNSTDACGIESETSPKRDFVCTDVGTQQVRLSVEDKNGNSDSKLCDVIVEDKVKPDAQCQDISVQLDENGTATLSGAGLDNGSADACGLQDFGVSESDFTCADIGDNPVTLTVIDNNGNENTCSAMVRVLASDFCPDSRITNEDGPSISDPCTCSATPNYFDEEVLITSNNPGEAWRIQSMTGLVNPNDFPNEFSVGDLFVDQGEGTYSLVGMHASGVGYSIEAVSDFYPNVVLSISNLCYLPELTISDAAPRVCSNDALGIILENASPSAQADRFEVSNIDLGEAVQLNGIEAGMSSSSADLLADMVFEYTGTGSTTVEITVIPYNSEDCAGTPLVVSVQVENCEKPVVELPIMNLGMLLIYLMVVVSISLFVGFRMVETATYR